MQGYGAQTIWFLLKKRAINSFKVERVNAKAGGLISSGRRGEVGWTRASYEIRYDRGSSFRRFCFVDDGAPERRFTTGNPFLGGNYWETVYGGVWGF